jgi:holo-[acyl-carrier protein] synthase
MLGCDIVKVSRFKNNLSKLANKILSESELVEFNKATNKLQYIAGRWAAKEAIFKATGNRRMTILNSTTGSPYVVNNPNIKISISHEKEYAIAVALLVYP